MMEPQVRPWGLFYTVYQNEKTWTKVLHLYPDQSLSLQYHDNRSEYWVPLDTGLVGYIDGQTLDLRPGVRYSVPRQTAHRVANPTDWTLTLLEVAVGRVDEKDIVRLSDKYGRK